MLKATRINDFTLELDNQFQSKIYANDHIDIERSALEEAETFSGIEGIQHLSFTPDFHKGNGTPIGTVALIDRVYPSIVGNDIGCGMRFDKLSIPNLEVNDHLKNKLRGIFFEGKREVLNYNRENILRYGDASLDCLKGSSVERISKNHEGQIYKNWLGEGELSHVLSPYYKIRSDRDNFLGTVGGGNHFVELQVVDEIVDKDWAYEYRLKVGTMCLMIHSGSLDNGHQVAQTFSNMAKTLHKGKHPENGYFYLDNLNSKHYINAQYNAANFATVNRAVMSGMVCEALDCSAQLIYDAPHNFVEKNSRGYLHRKGACPAESGDTVIIPGSMGTRSCIAIALGFKGTKNSAPHGAGRILNRNSSRKNADDLHGLEIVTKIDPKRVRSDVAKEVMKNLNEESPRSYKDVTQVVNSVKMAGIAKPIVWTRPLLTIKG